VIGAGPTLVSADNDGELAVWALESSERPDAAISFFM